jgi:hypothetical protein
MTAKKRAIEFISSLPDELSEAEIQEYWLTHQRIQEGIKSAEEEPLVDRSQLRGLVRQWLDEL